MGRTTEIEAFCDKQHLKYIAHITRLDIDSLQSSFFFCSTSRTSANRWKKLATISHMDKSQLRHLMAKRKEFQRPSKKERRH